jgi:hypothetical protein
VTLVFGAAQGCHQFCWQLLIPQVNAVFGVDFPVIPAAGFPIISIKNK